MLIKQTKEMTEAERIAAENSNNQYLQALSYAAVGMIYPYAGTEAPDTFMICDGTALNVTEYPELFSVIGYTFGGSDDTFNLPDLRGKTLVGMQADDSDFGTIGKSGGEKTHKMTAEENGKHTHPVIKAFGDTALDSSNHPAWAVKLLESAISNTSANPSTGSTAGIGYSGEGKAHNNLQPYTVINYIIKVVQGIPNLETALPIDQTYNPESENAQSGKAVAEAIANAGGADCVGIDEIYIQDGNLYVKKTTDVAAVNLGYVKGEKGDKGDSYVLNEADKVEIANIVLTNFTDVAEVGQ